MEFLTQSIKIFFHWDRFLSSACPSNGHFFHSYVNALSKVKMARFGPHYNGYSCAGVKYLLT